MIKIQSRSLIANIIEIIFLKSVENEDCYIKEQICFWIKRNFLQDIGKKAILSSQLGICAITCVSSLEGYDDDDDDDDDGDDDNNDDNYG